MTDDIRGLYYYLKADEHGAIINIRRSSQRWPVVPDDFTELMCRDCIDKLGADPYGVRLEGEHLVYLQKVSIAANTALIRADNEDTALVCVKGLGDEFETIGMVVNGDHVDLPKGENLEFKTGKPGSWQVAVDDRRVKSTVESLTVKAVSREEYDNAR